MKHQPRKRFGQNFLRDEGIIQRIVDSVSPQSSDHLVEIGPGQGAITDSLAASGAKLDCIELDRDLASSLVARYRDNERVSIYQRDILKTDLSELHEPAAGKMRVVGNLPYNISTPVMFHLLNYRDMIQDMTFMLQLEVVQRLSASVGQKNWGRLGIMTQYHCQVEHLFNVPSAAFYPKPKVSSAIVRLVPHRQPPYSVNDVSSLQEVLRYAFNQRRKTLRNSLKPLLSAEQIEALSIDPSERPENLGLAQFVAIADACTAQS